MMLFVANIGSTMARMFAFVFSRIMMIFCCRMSRKKKRALALKNRRKFLEKTGQLSVIQDEKPLISKPIESVLNIQPQIPADIRLNMLTGIHSNTKLNEEKPRDPIMRINELIRQNSSQNIEDDIKQEETHRRKSIDISPIQYYIDETNKLTNNLDRTVENPDEQVKSNRRKEFIDLVLVFCISRKQKRK